MVYDVDAGMTKKILSSSVIPDLGAGEINSINITANDMFLDDTLTGSTFGSVFDIAKTVNFSTSTDGVA